MNISDDVEGAELVFFVVPERVALDMYIREFLGRLEDFAPISASCPGRVAFLGFGYALNVKV